MPDSRSLDAEHRVQPRFSKFLPLVFLLAPLCVLLFAQGLVNLPDRKDLGQRIARVDFEAVQLSPAGFPPLRLAGAWKVTSDDSRVGGISALAIVQQDLLALSDAGVLVRLPKPLNRQDSAVVAELPAGPGSPKFKRDRDSEALVRDPFGRGWWVAFETHHELWLYDSDFGRALLRIQLGPNRWPPNAGIEGIAAPASEMLLFPEIGGGETIRVRGQRAEERRLVGRIGPISDAAALPGGELILLERRMTWRGFANALVVLAKQGETYRTARRLVLPIGPLDNAEAIAAESLDEGTLRLWIMTDDNHQRPFRTLLVAVDVPRAAFQP